MKCNRAGLALFLGFANADSIWVNLEIVDCRDYSPVVRLGASVAHRIVRPPSAATDCSQPSNTAFGIICP